MPGPKILRAATSRALCEVALNELTDPVVLEEQDSYAKYRLTPTCAEIARKAHKDHVSAVASVRAGLQPSTLIIGNFREPRPSPQRPARIPGSVYLVIALTTLNAETGILNFFPRDSSGQASGKTEVQVEKGELSL